MTTYVSARAIHEKKQFCMNAKNTMTNNNELNSLAAFRLAASPGRYLTRHENEARLNN